MDVIVNVENGLDKANRTFGIEGNIDKNQNKCEKSMHLFNSIIRIPKNKPTKSK
jgi:hypothetical protein